MQSRNLTQDEVIQRSATLPAFPDVVLQILSTIDDPDSCIKDVVRVVSHDPVIAARILSTVNAASARRGRSHAVTDLQTALSLIGLSKLRQIALFGSIGNFAQRMAATESSAILRRHSVSVAIACDELSMFLEHVATAEMATVTGLLHDVGQLWFHFDDPERFHKCWTRAIANKRPVEMLEKDVFGVDHAKVGAWLAEYWNLPADIVIAIGAHHAPETALRHPLVPLVHVAETVSHGLGLMGPEHSHVNHLSAAACQTLGITWDDDMQEVFGRIEARSQHINRMFNQYGSTPLHGSASTAT